MKWESNRKNFGDYTPSTYESLMKDLEDLNGISELDEEQVLKIKEKFKEVEISLKDKIRPKTITISGSIHNKVKKYCTDLNENIGEWSEKILLREVNTEIIPKKKEDNISILVNSLKVYKSEYIKKCGSKIYEPDTMKEINKINMDIEFYKTKSDKFQVFKEVEEAHKFFKTDERFHNEHRLIDSLLIKLKIKDKDKSLKFKNNILSILSEYSITSNNSLGGLIDDDGELVRIFTTINGKNNVDSPFDEKTHSNLIPRNSKLENIVEFLGFSKIDETPIFGCFKTNNSWRGTNYMYSHIGNTFDYDKSMYSQFKNVFGFELDMAFELEYTPLSSKSEHFFPDRIQNIKYQTIIETNKPYHPVVNDINKGVGSVSTESKAVGIIVQDIFKKYMEEVNKHDNEEDKLKELDNIKAKAWKEIKVELDRHNYHI